MNLKDYLRSIKRKDIQNYNLGSVCHQTIKKSKKVKQNHQVSWNNTLKVINNQPSLSKSSSKKKRLESGSQTLREKQEQKPKLLSKENVNHLIENIYIKHEQMKKHLKKLREQKEKRQREQFNKLSFAPSTNKSPRYRPQGNFFDRQKEKIQQRENYLLKMQKQIAEIQLKECRFHPQIVSKDQSLDLLKQRQRRLANTDDDDCSQKEHSQLHEKKFQLIMKVKQKKKQGLSEINLRTIKHVFRLQLQKIDI